MVIKHKQYKREYLVIKLINLKLLSCSEEVKSNNFFKYKTNKTIDNIISIKIKNVPNMIPIINNSLSTAIIPNDDQAVDVVKGQSDYSQWYGDFGVWYPDAFSFDVNCQVDCTNTPRSLKNLPQETVPSVKTLN